MSDPNENSPSPSTHAQAPAANGAPSDRATTFQAVQGPQPEHYSGEVLLVSAYCVLWVILLAWVGLLWRKQSQMGARLDDLELVLDRAAAKNPQRSGA